MAAARGGDRRALRRLLERMSRPIYRFGRGFCRNTEDAEDVMQEVLASLVRSLPTFRGEASLSSWAYTVARHACIRQRRMQAHAMRVLAILRIRVRHERGKQPLVERLPVGAAIGG